MPGPEALDPAAVNLPARAREILIKGRTSWLKNTEVLDLLLNNKEYRFTVSREAPHRPPGMSQGSRRGLQPAQGC